MPIIRCPYCGNKNTINIIYGLPTYDAFMEEKLEKIKLGGCVIEHSNPRKYCIICKNSFDRNMILSFEINILDFFIGGYTGISHKIHIIKNKNIWNCIHNKSEEQYTNFIEKKNINLNIDNWNIIWEKINKCYIEDWRNKYEDHSIIDGTSWNLSIHIEKNKLLSNNEDEIIIKEGINAFPVYFNRLLNIFKKLFGEKIA